MPHWASRPGVCSVQRQHAVRSGVRVSCAKAVSQPFTRHSCLPTQQCIPPVVIMTAAAACSVHCAVPPGRPQPVYRIASSPGRCCCLVQLVWPPPASRSKYTQQGGVWCGGFIGMPLYACMHGPGQRVVHAAAQRCTSKQARRCISKQGAAAVCTLHGGSGSAQLRRMISKRGTRGALEHGLMNR